TTRAVLFLPRHNTILYSCINHKFYSLAVLRHSFTSVFCCFIPPSPICYTLSLHDALPILQTSFLTPPFGFALFYLRGVAQVKQGDRKSTRLNSSHVKISYAVFCLKKKNIEKSSSKKI